MTFPDNASVAYEYDAFGNRTKDMHTGTDGTARATLYVFDELKRLKSVKDALNRTTAFEYAVEGGAECCGGSGSESRPTLITLPIGKKVASTYDAAGQRKSMTVGAETAEAATTLYDYDAAGNLKAETNAFVKIWSLEYDERDRPKKAFDPLLQKTEWRYDAASNVLKTIWPDGGETINTYDARNRLLTARDPKLQTVSLAYDNTARTMTLTDARLKNTIFQHDERGRRTRKTYHDGSFEAWTYGTNHNLQTHTTPAGQTMTVSYDDRDRPTLFDWNDAAPDVVATYDAHGRLWTLTNQHSALSYGYDAAGQLRSETQDLQSPVDLPPKTVSYDYNEDGQRKTLGYPGGTSVSYGYTQRNQLETITADGPPPLATYGYDLAGRRTNKTLENGASAIYGYDDADQLKTIDHRKADVSFQRFDYELNVMGSRKNRKESVAGSSPVTDTYGYDEIQQVTGVKYRHNATASTQAREVTCAY